MDERERTAVESLILKLSKRQQEIESEDVSFYNKVERVDKLTRYIAWLASGFAAVLIWATKLTINIDTLQRELDSRKIICERVNEMWWMKENGLTNRESYQKQHGYTPPP